MVMVMVVVILALPLKVAEATILVTLENDMIQPISISCHSKYEGDLGLRFLNPTEVYTFQVPGKFMSGKRYSCTFVAIGEPTTTFDVFSGWGGVHNSPCGCLGATCPWLVTANGFSCNYGKFSRGWGN